MPCAPILFMALLLQLLLPGRVIGSTGLEPLELEPGKDLRFLAASAGYLLDEDSKLQAADLVRADMIAKLKKPAHIIPNFSYQPGAVWMVLRLLNPEPVSVPQNFHLENSLMDHIAVYLWQKGTWLEEIHVDHAKFSTPPAYVARSPVFTMRVPPGESLFILRIQSETAITIPLSLRTEKNLWEDRLIQNAGLGVAYGVLIGMIAYNLFLAISLLNLTYAVYVAFIALSTFNFASFHGISQSFFPLEWHRAITHSIAPIGHSTVFLALWFGARFLDMKHAMPRTYRFYQIIMGLAVLGFLFVTSSYQTSAKMFSLLTMTSSLALLVSGLFRIRQGYRPAYFFTIAWLTVLIGHITLALFVLGVMPVNPISMWGAFVGSVIEVVLLSLGLGDKFRYEQRLARVKIASLNRELETERDHVLQLNQGLELLVEKKTRNIRSIMQNIRQGIFTVDTVDGRIGEETSDFLKDILPTRADSDARLESFLLAQSDLKADERQQIAAVLQMTLMEDELAWQCNESKFPRALTVPGVAGEPAKILELDWNPVFDQTGRVERILVCLRDVTQIRELQRDVEKRDEKFQIIKSLIDLTETKFTAVADQVEGLIDKAKDAAADADLDPKVMSRRVGIALHTIKGIARTYGMKSLAETTHQIENLWMQAQDHEALKALSGELEQLRSTLRSYRLIGMNDLNWQGKTSGLVFERQAFESLVQKLHEMKAENFARDRWDLFAGDRRHLLVGIGAGMVDILREFSRELTGTARELEKRPPRLETQGWGVCFNTKGQSILSQVMGHLLRNALDHGIESEAERRRQQKPAEGLIMIEEVMVQGQLQLRIHDDGQGLDLQKIRTRAQTKFGMDPSALQDDAAVAEVLFMPGFSTRDQISLVSGRGVGLDAVRSLLREAGGDIHIELQEQTETGRRPFVFTLEIPEALYWSLTLPAPSLLERD
jgi:HPt (histidine-containing phosphotransfer) domain-containing protein